MLKKSFVIATAAALFAAAGSAQAAVSVFYFPLGAGVDHPDGITQIDDFGAATPGVSLTALDHPVDLGGVTDWSGTGYIQDVSNGNGAIPAGVYTGIPALYLKGNAKGDFLTVEGGDSETLKLTSDIDKYIQIYVGSLDAYNTLKFTLKDGQTDTFNGGALATYSHEDDGNQSIGKTNGYFTFLFDSPIKEVDFSSQQNSFEIGEINVAPTPEPATWSLLILGVGLTGAALRLSRRNTGPVVAAV